MKPGSVLVDIAIDQGGCFEDSHPTTHADPVFMVHNSVFYCVANMPGAVPNTSTYALTNATLPYVVELADQGWRAALRADPALAGGLNTHEGAAHQRPGRRRPTATSRSPSSPSSPNNPIPNGSGLPSPSRRPRLDGPPSCRGRRPRTGRLPPPP